MCQGLRYPIQAFHPAHIALNVELPVHAARGHGPDLAEHRSFLPGPIVQTEDPGHVGGRATIRKAQHPLAHRVFGKDFIHQQGGTFRHAPRPAAGAEAASIVTEGDQVAWALQQLRDAIAADHGYRFLIHNRTRRPAKPSASNSRPTQGCGALCSRWITPRILLGCEDCMIFFVDHKRRPSNRARDSQRTASDLPRRNASGSRAPQTSIAPYASPRRRQCGA